MAYPTGMLSIVLEQIDIRLLRMKANLQLIRNASAAGDLAATRITDLFIQLKAERASLAAAIAKPGLIAYAQAQKDTPGLNVDTEFTAVIAAIDATTDWIVANFPKDANGFLLAQTWGAAGPVDRLFTTGALSGFRTQLDSLIATVA